MKLYRVKMLINNNKTYIKLNYLYKNEKKLQMK